MSRFLIIGFVLLWNVAHATEPTYLIPEEEFNQLSTEERIEYVRDILDIFAQHEKTWNYDSKIALNVFFESAFAAAPDKAKYCILGARKVPRDPTTKICSTIMPTTCGPNKPSMLFYQCGDLALNKCIDRRPTETLSKRCFEEAQKDPDVLKKITQPQLDAAVQMYQSACETIGDSDGCFFLEAQLKKKSTFVGKNFCEKTDDANIITAGNILSGNGPSGQRAYISYSDASGRIKRFSIGDLQCSRCHNANISDLTYRSWNQSAEAKVYKHINDYASGTKMGTELGKIKAGPDGEAAMKGIACFMGRFIDIGKRYPSVITEDRSLWKIPTGPTPGSTRSRTAN